MQQFHPDICVASAQLILTVGTIVFGLYVATRLLGIEVGGGGGGAKERGRGRRRGRSAQHSPCCFLQPRPGLSGFCAAANNCTQCCLLLFRLILLAFSCGRELVLLHCVPKPGMQLAHLSEL